MTRIQISATADLRGLVELEQAFATDFRTRAGRPVKESFNGAGEILLNYLKRRYITLSSGGGGGQWDDIQEETKRAKERKGRPVRPNWVMREFNQTLNAFEVKRVGKDIKVGLLEDKPRVIDPTREVQTNQTLISLAMIHHQGIPPQPPRPIIPLAIPPRVLKKMTERIVVGVDQMIENTKKS